MFLHACLKLLIPTHWPSVFFFLRLTFVVVGVMVVGHRNTVVLTNIGVDLIIVKIHPLPLESIKKILDILFEVAIAKCLRL